MRLVFVHGRSQEGKNPDELKHVWTEGLHVGLSAAGLSGIGAHEIVFPFYGDDLAGMVKTVRQAGKDVRAKGSDFSALPIERTQVELLQEIAGEADVAIERDAEAVHKGMMNTSLALMLARLADGTSYGANFLNRWTEDVAVYLNNQVVTRKVDAYVRAAICDQECVVVAHSLGSIVAYRVLRAMGPIAHVKRLITLGSPLGLETVRHLLAPPALEFPSGVESWINAFDPKDIVALRPLDERTWAVKPRIVNYPDVRNHMDNHHNISGYLDDPYVARAIYTALNNLAF
jgi:hypothetical protein